MTSKALIQTLLDLEEARWGDLKVRPIDARRLALLLRQYGVESRQVRVGDVTAKGLAPKPARPMAAIPGRGYQWKGNKGNRMNKNSRAGRRFRRFGSPPGV